VDEFLTVAEVAGLLKLNQQTVRNWIDADTLPAIHVGRRVRIKRTDLDRLLEAGYTGAAATPRTARLSIWDGEIPPPEGSVGGGPRTPRNDRARADAERDGLGRIAHPGAARARPTAGQVSCRPGIHLRVRVLKRWGAAEARARGQHREPRARSQRLASVKRPRPPDSSSRRRRAPRP
jgi:excisionase family DNA binding protein